MITCVNFVHLSGDVVSMATYLKVDKDEDAASIADSAIETVSVISGATFTGTQYSEVSYSIHIMIEICHYRIWAN